MHSIIVTMTAPRSSRLLLVAIVIIGVGWGGTVAAAATAADQNVQAELLADLAAVQPGKPFTVGVRLTIRPGWHVYWKNPGDSGIPTSVEFTLPEGFVAGPLQYPVPRRIEAPGGIVNYGYEDEVMLLATITPPADLREQTVHLGAKVNWLVCQENCIPGNAEPSLDLPVQPSAKPANVEVFENWTRRLPVPAEKLSGVGVQAEPLDISSGHGETQIHLTLAMKDAAIPDTIEGLELRISAPDPVKTGTRYAVQARVLKGQPLAARAIQVLIGPYVVTIPLVGAAGPATAPGRQ